MKERGTRREFITEAGSRVDPGATQREHSTTNSLLIAVWTELEPLPKVYADPLPIILGLLLFWVIHASVYQSVGQAWPEGVIPRATRFAGILFGIGFLFWEFFTPFNLFGEPILLIGLELLFWAIIAGTEAISIAAVFESNLWE